ncbi:MAG: response regulator [Candidatus Omnitrophica bacterium]|nr:response regulator [Candidatus Omnitrophota bacterium]
MDEQRLTRVLVVDDEQGVRNFLKKLLELKGAIVTLANNGYEGIDAAGHAAFDWIFLDIRMPGIDGVQTLKKLKALQPSAKFVMMTGYSVEGLLAEAKDDGIFASIKKPFDINQVTAFLGKEFVRSEKEPLSVLVIDDDKAVLDTFTRVLKSAACSVTCADTGGKALEAIASQDFSLVFLDIKLKDSNGIELFNKLMQLRPNLKVLLMTGYREEVEKDIKGLSVRGCLFKPFEISKIFQEIDQVRKEKEASADR